MSSPIVPSPVANYLLREGSGSTVHDTSGNGYNGTITPGPNAAVWVPQGLYFYGDKQSTVVLPDTTLANDNTSVTDASIEVWIKLAGIPTAVVGVGNYEIVSLANRALALEILIFTFVTGGFTVTTWGTQGIAFSAGPVLIAKVGTAQPVPTGGLWFHLIFSRIQSNSFPFAQFVIYLNGTEFGNTFGVTNANPLGLAASPGSKVLGGDAVDGYPSFMGTLGEARIYNVGFSNHFNTSIESAAWYQYINTKRQYTQLLPFPPAMEKSFSSGGSAFSGTNPNFGQPMYFRYGTSIYVITSVDGTNAIYIFKSTDEGLNWALLYNLLPAADQFGGFARIGTVLFGTTLYIFHPFDATANPFKYIFTTFDFTTDLFLDLTGIISFGPPFPAQIFLAGNDAAHLLLIVDYNNNGDGFFGGGPVPKNNKITIYSMSGASLALIIDTSYDEVTLATVITGASGVTHIFYAGYTGITGSSGGGTPIDLRYTNYQIALGTSITVRSSISFMYGTVPLGDSAYNIFYAQALAYPVQIGSFIYFSFYDYLTQQIMLCKFDDSLSPSFTFGVIEPSWNLNPTIGDFLSSLEYDPVSGLLYCFYCFTKPGGFGGLSGATGDNTLYYRVSSDNGATWGAKQVLIQTDAPILWPQTAVRVAGASYYFPLLASYIKGGTSSFTPPSINVPIGVVPTPPTIPPSVQYRKPFYTGAGSQ